ncbi:hypothetical protein APR41_18110 [Salegentibacter salinarum]|uniref:N-terminal cleavage protein n=1 Tax=Salegentibacter salinarum TaxID=447422 RepID=A0A2N0TTM4_9FLAO|nr:hypothetical protein [Salegentibacter salinarum]PKD18028.1 hypothetical protein APR41_18110 [Salegentibacter salinarum]SKB99488.1 hypothetical protein SAMN05660903_03704 [Salegentibacter salinarum]
MALLKRLKGASLMETLTASVIVVIVFMIANLSFSNIFLSTIKSNSFELENRKQELKYLIRNGKLELPYFGEGAYWNESIQQSAQGKYVILEIINDRNNKIWTDTLVFNN